ncbi:MAG: class I SAM-dependent methyltransferase [Brevundimonas sp.]
MTDPSQSVVDLYHRRAAQFDADRTRTLFERPWLEAFTALLPAGGEVLDMACGSGKPISAYLIDNGAKITGVDAAPAMIDLCRQRFPDHRWMVGDMRHWHSDDAFDGVVVWHGLIHLTADDQRQTIPRLAGCLRPGAPLLFTAAPESGETVGVWRGEPLYHGGLDPSETDALLTASGLRILQRRLSDPDCGGASVWLARQSEDDRRFPSPLEGEGVMRSMTDEG